MLKVHLWIPNIFEFKGGIQVYSEFLLKAIHSFKVKSCHVIIKHDKRVPISALQEFSLFQFHCSGSWPLALRTHAFAAQLISSAIQDKPDLIIATHINFTLLAYHINRLLDIPYWAVAHGVEAWNIKSPSLQRALKNSDLVLSVSNYTRNQLITEGYLQPHKIQILPNTFDENLFVSAAKLDILLQRYKLKVNQPIILTVARLDKREGYKGYDRIIKALTKVKTQIPDVHYLLVGKGGDRSRIEQIIKELQLENHVTLAGFVPDEELCDHYNLCDVFAMPSKGEGFGIVYLEAMACGKPCLGGNQDGALDALDQGEIGVLVNPDDIDEIADALIRILEKKYPNPLLYQPEQLRQAVIDRFGFEIFQQRLHQYLDDFMACRNLI